MKITSSILLWSLLFGKTSDVDWSWYARSPGSLCLGNSQRVTLEHLFCIVSFSWEFSYILLQLPLSDWKRTQWHQVSMCHITTITAFTLQSLNELIILCISKYALLCSSVHFPCLQVTFHISSMWKAGWGFHTTTAIWWPPKKPGICYRRMHSLHEKKKFQHMLSGTVDAQIGLSYNLASRKNHDYNLKVLPMLHIKIATRKPRKETKKLRKKTHNCALHGIG